MTDTVELLTNVSDCVLIRLRSKNSPNIWSQTKHGRSPGSSSTLPSRQNSTQASLVFLLIKDFSNFIFFPVLKTHWKKYLLYSKQFGMN